MLYHNNGTIKNLTGNFYLFAPHLYVSVSWTTESASYTHLLGAGQQWIEAFSTNLDQWLHWTFIGREEFFNFFRNHEYVSFQRYNWCS